MITPTHLEAAERIIEKLRSQSARLVTAESCTGGLIAACLTSVAGSSDVVDRGLVTYSNIAKQQLLTVTTETLEAYGAVSEQTAIAMAQGALINTSTANVSIAVTGIAGPGGGSDDKPVGLVHLAAAHRNPSQTKDISVRHREARYGDIGRQEVRMATVMTAFEMLSEILEGE